MNNKLEIYLDFIRNEYRQGREEIGVSLYGILKVLFKWGSAEYKSLPIEEKVRLLQELAGVTNNGIQSLYFSYLERFLKNGITAPEI